jgi:hypothetical protein
MNRELIDKIIEALERERGYCADPGSYMTSDWYTRCAAKEEAFDEAIDIIKGLCQKYE